MTFGPRLREILNQCQVTQTALAKGLGVSSQTVNQWATGTTGPVVAKLWPIAGYLGLDVTTLVDVVGSPIVRHNGDQLTLSVGVDLPVDPGQRREAALLYRAWSDLDEPERAKIASAIEVLRLSRGGSMRHTKALS
jgi:transcriptional regulator with XRE-family HTH domain